MFYKLPVVIYDSATWQHLFFSFWSEHLDLLKGSVLEEHRVFYTVLYKYCSLLAIRNIWKCTFLDVHKSKKSGFFHRNQAEIF